MIELTTPPFLPVFPFLDGLPQPVLPRAVAEGRTPGRVFIDPFACQAVIIWLPCGYLYLMGEPDQLDEVDLRSLFTTHFIPGWKDAGERGFILAPFSDSWTGLLNKMLAEEPHANIFRRAFSFDPARFDQHIANMAPLRAGYELTRMDARLAELMGADRTWHSAADFEATGIGYVVMYHQEVVSSCYSVFGCSTGLEVNVHTAESYRGLGLAAHSAAAFIKACLEAGLTPNWECFWDNIPSGKLAERLGFIKKLDYPVIYWEPQFS